MNIIDSITPYNVVQCAKSLLALDISVVQARVDEKFALDIAYLEQLLKDYQYLPWLRAYPGMTLFETNDLLLQSLTQQTQCCVSQLASEGQNQLLQQLNT